MKNQAVCLLAAVLSLPCANVSASKICTDRSPAAVARALDIPLSNDRVKRRDDRPNVVIIIVDDMGYSDPGVYGGQIPTPNMDRIAADGARFTDGYAASPICSPSRAGLMTGRQPNLFGYARNLIGSQNHNHGLPLSEKTIADYFNQAGYATGFVGKWHLGDAGAYAPHNRGFDEYFKHPHGDSSYYFSKYKDKISHNLDRSVLSRMESCKDEDKYLTDILGMEAASFILRHANEPFLLLLSTNAVHAPLEARQENREELLAYYRHPGYMRHASDPKKLTYLRMVMQLDEAIGHVLDAIELSGLSESTLVWFFSDNGGHRIGADNGVLRDYKGSSYEGGIRVPFMIRWLGTISAAVHKWPITTLDVVPTSLAAAGLYSEKDFPSLSGMNMLPHLKENSSPPPVRDLYWRTQKKGRDKHLSRDAIRGGNWKLIRDDHGLLPDTRKPGTRKPGTYELYDLKRDISERNNLVDEEPQVFESLREKIAAYRNTVAKARW